MLGKQRREQDLFCYVQLEELVPQDHILRKIKEEIDFRFIDELTEPLYSDKGRPSIAPQVLIRMLLIGYLYGINGERRLCREVHLNIAYCWKIRSRITRAFRRTVMDVFMGLASFVNCFTGSWSRQ